MLTDVSDRVEVRPRIETTRCGDSCCSPALRHPVRAVEQLPAAADTAVSKAQSKGVEVPIVGAFCGSGAQPTEHDRLIAFDGLHFGLKLERTGFVEGSAHVAEKLHDLFAALRLLRYSTRE